MNLISRLFGKSSKTSEVLCPRCERAMEPDHKCAGMSRRFFFGMGLGAVVAVSAAPALDWTVTIETGPSFVSRNVLISPRAFAEITLKQLREFGVTGGKIGDTIKVRRPSRFVGVG